VQPIVFQEWRNMANFAENWRNFVEIVEAPPLVA
jgi:hypothetical protein